MMHESSAMNRRTLLRHAAGAAGMLALPADLLAGLTREAAGARAVADVDVAVRAAQWIRSSRIATAEGVTWPADPRDANSVVRNLYSGTPGVVLFLLELHHATGESAFLDEARRGADDLAAHLATGEFDGGGLYTGVAGRGFVLAETWRATGDTKYRDAARLAVQVLRDNALVAGNGIEWSDSADIISGGAGIALFLLYAARTLDEADAVDLALRAGRRLVALGRPAGGGLEWAISPRVPNLYPNFSHGAAGVAYALATIHTVTGEKELLDAALAGAHYLDAVTDRTSGCRIFHHKPDGEDLFYLSWCHGGAGTARLFYRLAEATNDTAWLDRIDCFARGITSMGAPVARSPGYWDNISQCCGNAGVGEFFLSIHRLWPDRGYLGVARRAADDILTRATQREGSLQWVQAEHRVRPELLVAQTGHMQGAAGVGTFFLRLDALRAGRTPRVTFPDSPFTS